MDGHSRTAGGAVAAVASGASFGELLRDRRERAGLTQRALALAAGVSVAAVRDLEQRRSRRPRTGTTAALAGALGLAPDEVAGLLEAARERTPGSGPPGARVVRVSVLGPLSIHSGACDAVLASAAQRAVLAALALRPNRVLSRDHLIEALWPDEPPAAAVGLLHAYVARLRRRLRAWGSGRSLPAIASVPGGYRLDADPASLDLIDFRRTVAAARTAPAGDRCDLLGRALDLWRGEPLSDLDRLAGYPVLTALREELVAAAVEYAGAADALGRHRDVCARLVDLLPRHPYHEPLHARFIMALARSGDQAGALRAYDAIRGRLAGELGLDPGPELVDLQARILRQQVAAGPGPRRPAGGPATVCHLPPDLPDHTGHRAQVAEVCALLTPAGDPRVCPPVVVSGPGGAGKTAFAVHVAHRLRTAFPDGQVLLDLGGPAGVPVAPGEAMSRMLRALRVPEPDERDGFDDTVVRYRSMVDGRRILVVLDGVVGVEQVRPFLPGGSGSAVVVTTRRRLTTLAGAHQVDLPALDERDATALLERVVGPGRTRAEPAAVVALVGMCAGLPLALRIAGARLAARPHWPVSRLVERMRDERRRLDELSASDLQVRACLATTYETLSAPARRAFEALGSQRPGDPVLTVAGCMATDPATAEDLVEELVDARLVDVVTTGAAGIRYRMPELVRLYARECAARTSVRRAATPRRVPGRPSAAGS